MTNLSMTMSNLTKNLPLLLCFTLLTFLSNAQIEKIQYTPTPMKALDKQKPVSKPDYSLPSDLPADFPKYIETGNPTLDLANYQNAKSVWYVANPEYAKKNLSNTNSSASKFVYTKEEFDKLSSHEQKIVLSHPERFEIKK